MARESGQGTMKKQCLMILSHCCRKYPWRHYSRPWVMGRMARRAEREGTGEHTGCCRTLVLGKCYFQADTPLQNVNGPEPAPEDRVGTQRRSPAVSLLTVPRSALRLGIHRLCRYGAVPSGSVGPMGRGWRESMGRGAYTGASKSRRTRDEGVSDALSLAFNPRERIR